MKTVELDIRIKVNVSDDVKFVTVDEDCTICEHFNTPKPIRRSRDGLLSNEWTLTNGKVIRNWYGILHPVHRARQRYSVVNWRETLTDVK